MKCALLFVLIACGLAVACSPATLRIVFAGIAENGRQLSPVVLSITLTDRFGLRVDVR